MFKRIGLQITALAMSVFALSACAPPTGMQAEDSNPGGLTGFSDGRGAPYTVGGDPRLLGQGGTKPPTPPPSDADVSLAKKVLTIRMVRLDKSGKIDRLGSAGVRLLLTLEKGESVEFEGALSSTTAGRFQSSPILSSNRDYSLTADFTDDGAKRESMGFLLVKKLDKKGKSIAQTAIYSRAYEAKVQSLPSNEQKLNVLNQRLLKLVRENPRAWVTNVIVEKARSFYEVHVYAAPEKGTKPDRVTEAASGRRLFSFGGEAKRTDDFVPVEATAVAGILKPLSVQLIGDAETLDQRTFSVLVEGQENQNIDFALKIEHLSPEILATPTPTLRGVRKDSFFPAQYKHPQRPGVTKIIDDFERNYSLPDVQFWIKKYTGPTPEHANLQRIMDGTIPARNIITSIFHYFDVAPPAAVVTWIESPNYYTNNYLTETNPQSSATGPFQLTTGPAQKLGLNVFNNLKGELPPLWDERHYLATSACGAAKLFRDSQTRFAKQDSTLILLAYHLGDPTVARYVQPTSIKKYGLTYRDIAQQRIIHSDVRNYMSRALALYFISGNPTEYGYEIASAGRTLPPGKITPAKGISDGQCFMAVSSGSRLK